MLIYGSTVLSRFLNKQTDNRFKKINIIGDSALDEVFPDKKPCFISIKTREGKQFIQRNDGPFKGEPENPLSEEEIEKKFNKMAVPVLGQEKSNQIISSVRRLDKLDDVSKFVDLFSAQQISANI